MAPREPSWWYGAHADGWLPRVLTPAGMTYGALTARRMQQPPSYTADIPVIAIGNFTAGGTGKTPFVRVVIDALRALGHTPAVLSRGYGRTTRTAFVVDSDCTSKTVGDEPLLLHLMNDVAVVVANDRAEGARMIERSEARLNATVIIMDDALQNPEVMKDLTFAVVDAARGFGNGRCIPAGPLRAPLAAQVPRIDALVLNGGDGTRQPDASVEDLRLSFRRPVLSGIIAPTGDFTWLQGARVVAYAGIGVPERFFATVAAAGGVVCQRVVFGDHHPFTDADAIQLLAMARNENALLVTTEKDCVRLHRQAGVLAELGTASRTLSVRLALDAESTLALQALLANRVPLPAGSPQ